MEISTSQSLVTKGPFFAARPDLYQGKEVTEIGINIALVGNITFFLVEETGVDKKFRIVKEYTHNFTQTGEQWINPGFGKIGEKQHIGIVKPNVDTAKFYYGGAGYGFDIFNLTTMVIPTVLTSSNNLNIGIKIKNPAKEVSKIDELNNKINSINNVLAGKKIAVTGDSITTDNSITAGNSLFYTPERVAQFGIATPADQWHGQLAKILNATVIANDAWSGSRVSGTTGSSLCQARATKLPTDADIIMIMIGINDLSGNVALGTFTPDKAEAELNVNEITDAYCLMLEKMMKRHTNARIICMSPLRRYTAVTTWKNTNNVTVDELAKRIEQICSHYGIEYIDMGGVGFNKHNYRTFIPDGTHPNKLGMKKIAEYLAGKIS